MEITDEIKAKVFFQYIGQMTIWEYNGRMWHIRIGLLNIHNVKDHIDDKKIVLKPLSAITDEESLEVANIVQPTGGLTAEDGKAIVSNLAKFELSVCCMIVQYLQLKGYDLPQYLLGGKTLEEVGLAIYMDSSYYESQNVI